MQLVPHSLSVFSANSAPSSSLYQPPTQNALETSARTMKRICCAHSVRLILGRLIALASRLAMSVAYETLLAPSHVRPGPSFEQWYIFPINDVFFVLCSSPDIVDIVHVLLLQFNTFLSRSAGLIATLHPTSFALFFHNYIRHRQA